MENLDSILLMKKLKSIVFLMVGVILLMVVALMMISTRNFLQEAVTAPGQVVALPSGGSHPQIEFVTRDGQRISYSQDGWIFGFKVGDKVTVLYRPEEPFHTATIDQFGAVWGGVIFILPLGIIFFFIGLLGVLKKKRGSEVGWDGTK